MSIAMFVVIVAFFCDVVVVEWFWCMVLVVYVKNMFVYGLNKAKRGFFVVTILVCSLKKRICTQVYTHTHICIHCHTAVLVACISASTV